MTAHLVYLPTLRAYDGTVVQFDDERGLGEVVAADRRRHPFHCTAIADGSRHVDVGAAVRFSLAPGHAGRLEARDVVVTGTARVERDLDS
ncbi:MAG TPA: hypothetical protein VND23_09965 [Acidimicrobiales bacterium]|nr:hypothetical protein [Acidimicrobiales bacterium]